MASDIPSKAREMRRSRIAKPILVIGLLFLIIGVSGVLWLSLPRSGTVSLAYETYVRLDGRYFGHLSGSYSSTRDADISIAVLDQHNWEIIRDHRTNATSESILLTYSNHGDLTEFSASLPASEAYYLYVFSAYPLPNQTAAQGYDPIVRVEVQWSVWGPSVNFSLVYSILILLGAAFALYGDHAGQNLLAGAIYGGWKRS